MELENRHGSRKEMEVSHGEIHMTRLYREVSI